MAERPQSGDSHSRLHRGKVQDPLPILSLRNLAAGERTAPEACACGSGPEGSTFAHSAGCSTEAPGCIGARGLRDGCAGLLPPPWSRQSSPTVPGLRLGREEDEDIVGWEEGSPIELGGGL